MSKKIMCLFVCAVMLFTLSLSVFAASEPVESNHETTALVTSIAAVGSEQNGFSSDAADAATLLASLGLFRGIGEDENGNPDFALDSITTRYEAIVMLIRLIGKEAEALREEWDLPFTDVDEWAKPYVGYAYAHGLTSGTAPTAFSGSDEVTAAQFTTFLLRALGYSSGDDFRWDAPWDFAESIGLSADEYADAVTSFFRSDAALLTVKALSAYSKDCGLLLSDKLIFDGIFSRKDYYDSLFGKTTDNDNTVWNGAVKPFTGYGFEWSPYLIESAENLAYLAQQVNAGNTYAGKYFRLTSDLDLGMHEWVPIGGYDNPFCGIFDGNGYTIHNLYISQFTSTDVSDWNQWHDRLSYVGLFGYTSGSAVSGLNGTIANLTVDGVIEIKADAETDKNGISVGGIVGCAQGDIINCRSNCDISVDSFSKAGYVTVGGIAGYHNDTTIDRCTNTGIIAGSGIHCIRVGGIVGDSLGANGGEILNCLNTGVVRASGTGSLVDCSAGGINAKINHDIVENCGNTGYVSSVRTAGGIIGYMSDIGKNELTKARIDNCFNAGIITGRRGLSGEITGAVYSGTVSSAYYLDRGTAACGTVSAIAEVGKTEAVQTDHMTELQNQLNAWIDNADTAHVSYLHWSIPENGVYPVPVNEATIVSMK